MPQKFCDLKHTRLLFQDPCCPGLESRLVDELLRRTQSQETLRIQQWQSNSKAEFGLDENQSQNSNSSKVQEQGRKGLLRRHQASSWHREPWFKRFIITSLYINYLSVVGYTDPVLKFKLHLRNYPRAFGEAMVVHREPLLSTSCTFLSKLPDRLPIGPEIFSRFKFEEEHQLLFANADLDSVVRYLRGGNRLMLPKQWKDLLYPTKYY